MRLSSITTTRRTPKASPLAAGQAQIRSLPAPTLGWNARDALSNMKVGYAIAMENVFPTTSDVRLRNGSLTHVTGMGGPVETLMIYSAGASDEMWAFSDDELYNVTTDTLPAATLTGLTNARWQHVNFSTSGDHFLITVNGADSLLIYDGTDWQAVTESSTPYAITGVTSSTLANLFVFKNRLFFLPISGLGFWFLPVDSIAGAASFFDLGPQCVDGGYIVAGGTWTRDGGDGMDDLCVFVTNHGECIIYQGSDPSDPSNWSKVGRYRIPAPIGARCLTQGGADLLVITIGGVISLSSILSLDPAQSDKASVSDNIRDAFNQAAASFRTSFGWQGIAYPAGTMAIFNIPVSENQKQQQFVMNAITGAWCKFTGLNANCWALFNERVYFGDNDGNVIQADTGDNDDSEKINWLLHTSYFADSPGLLKHYTMTKPITVSFPGFSYGIAVLTDYSTDYTQISNVVTEGTGNSEWNDATWDEADWLVSKTLRNWFATPAIGVAGSVALKGSTSGAPFSLNQLTLMYQLGGPLG